MIVAVDKYEQIILWYYIYGLVNLEKYIYVQSYIKREKDKTNS